MSGLITQQQMKSLEGVSIARPGVRYMSDLEKERLTKLMPCPFCGTEAEYWYISGYGHYIGCSNKTCFDLTMHFSNLNSPWIQDPTKREMIIKAWNKRPEPIKNETQ